MSPLSETAKDAIALYAIAARDVVDFIDMVNDSKTTIETLRLLEAMLDHPGELNEFIRPVVTRQIKEREKR